MSTKPTTNAKDLSFGGTTCVSGTFYIASLLPTREKMIWHTKSPRFEAGAALGCAYLYPSKALAQSPATNTSGFSFESLVEFFSPLSAAVASLAWVVLHAWDYVMTHAPAAVIISGLIALYVANRSIKSQREITRLRETFATIDKGIRDGDFIKSRTEFKNVKLKLAQDGENIAKYHKPTKDIDITSATYIRTILNDYENLALGMRYGILDEEYLFRWTRTMLITDWNDLMPLVTAYRSDGAPNAYIEFEGVATAWQRNESYRTGKTLRKPNRHTKVH